MERLVEPMALVYIVDDEPHIRRLAAIGLKDAGFETAEFSDGSVLLHAVQQKQPDAVLLDWMMPGQDGLAVLRAMRENSVTRPIPIIMMTARADEVDRVLGLELGADDYVTKPFVPMELLARVHSHLRRYEKFLRATGAAAAPALRTYVIGGLELCEDTAELTVDGTPVKLTPLEFKILALLMKNPGRVFSAEEIYERVWNERAVSTDTIMVHIRNIREKIEYNPREPKYLKVVWGIGYKIEK